MFSEALGIAGFWAHFKFGAIAFVAALAASPLVGVEAAQDSPAVVQGVLDLRQSDWNFDTDGTLPINEWAFYGSRLLDSAQLQDPENRKPDAWMRWPGFWQGLPSPEGEMKRFGFATLHLTVLLPEPSNGLAIKMGRVYSAYRMIVNGKIVAEIGTAGADARSTIANTREVLIPLPDGAETFDIVLNVSNFTKWLGGGTSYGSVFGSRDQILQSDLVYERYIWLYAGMLLILGLYHLGLFALRRNDRSTLWFALLTLSLFFRLLTQFYPFLFGIADGKYYEIASDINWFAAYVMMPLIALYVSSVLPDDYSRTVRATMLVIGFVGCASIFVLPESVFSRGVEVYIIAGLLMLAYSNYAVARAIVRGRKQSVLFFIAFFIFCSTIVISLMDVTQLVNTRELMPLGFVVFIAVQAFLLSQRFSRSFSDVETLSGELTAKNAHLENISAELAANNDRLERLDKIKDQFLANTSHELRTPLNGIIGLTESLRAGAKGPVSRQVDGTLEMIASSGRRLATLVNDILDASKLRNSDIILSRRAVDLHEVVEVVLQVSQPLVGPKPLLLSNRVPVSLRMVEADENRLQQILQNLIGNAIKFTPSGQVDVSACEKGQEVVVCVSDTGIGIPKDKYETIFESFEQVDASTEREFGGTGLGLSITRNLIELHGGRIWLNSTVDKGSEFFFTLPVASTGRVSGSGQNRSAKALQDNDPCELPAVASGGRVRGGPPAGLSATFQAVEGVAAHSKMTDGQAETSILVVDDDEINRHVVSNFLGLEDYEVFEASDGVQALEFLENSRPDVILLDIMMPKLNGYEVCRQIRARTEQSQMPIIFLSAKDRTEDLVVGFESGGNDYLSKPVSGPELLARVSTHAKLMRAQEDVLKLEKLAAIGNVTAGIVHDFKNSIGVIKGYAEMIAEDNADAQSESAEFAMTIASEADRISSMAYEILAFARGETSLAVDKLSVADFVAEFLKAIELPLGQRGVIPVALTTDLSLPILS